MPGAIHISPDVSVYCDIIVRDTKVVYHNCEPSHKALPAHKTRCQSEETQMQQFGTFFLLWESLSRLQRAWHPSPMAGSKSGVVWHFHRTCERKSCRRQQVSGHRHCSGSERFSLQGVFLRWRGNVRCHDFCRWSLAGCGNAGAVQYRFGRPMEITRIKYV